MACNCKILKENLDLQQDPIEESHIPTNKILVNRYQNYNRIIIEITG